MNKKTCSIIIRDEVKCSLSGLETDDMKALYAKYSIKIPNAYFLTTYQLGVFDGNVHFVDTFGNTFVRLLDEILPYLIENGYEFTLEDRREPINHPVLRVDENYFSKYVGYNGKPITLRPYQVRDVNIMLDSGSGFSLTSTGGGKTLLCAALCDVYGKTGYDTITIVPSEDLVKQTYDLYNTVEMDVGRYDGHHKDINAQHVVATWQSLQNNPNVMRNFDMVLVDECFSGDSLVSTPNGIKKISNIKRGDLIYSMNDDGTFIDDVVNDVYINLDKSKDSKMLELEFDNGMKIKVTENHEFFTENHGKVKASELTHHHDVLEFELLDESDSIKLINERLLNANQQLSICRYFEYRLSKNNVFMKHFKDLRLSNGIVIIKKSIANCIIASLLKSNNIVNNADSYYSPDTIVSESCRTRIKREISTKGGQKAWELHGDKMTKNLNNGVRPPWNKGIKTGLEPWNKGLTKHNSDKIKTLFSDTRHGKDNPAFGTKISDENKLKSSLRVKEAIKNGTWTPHPHNSMTSKNIVFNGVKFRSSWEVCFYHLNPKTEYETIRIPYITPEKINRIYIVDFIDREKRVLYEIKPKSKLGDMNIKLPFVLSWCKDNGFGFEMITEDYFKSHKSKIDFSVFNDDIKNKLLKMVGV